MTTITFEECITGTWRDSIRMVRQRPLLIAATTVAIYFVQFMQSKLHHAPRRHSLLIPLLILGLYLLKLLVMNVLAVQAIRYVVLGESHTGLPLGRNLWRYYGVSLGFCLAFFLSILLGPLIAILILRFIGIHGHGRALSMTLVFAALMLAVWINLRCSLVGCHVALGRPLNLRAAWRDSRGNVRRIVGFHCVLALSLCAILLPTALVGAVANWVLGESGDSPVFRLVESVAFGPMLIVAGAGSAWLYRRFARSLLESPGAPSAQSPG